MTADQITPQGGEPPAWLRLGLIAVAIIETIGGLSSVPVLFSEGPAFTGWAFAVRIVLVPLLAIAALVFALMGRLPRAIMAMAALVLATWLAEEITSFLHPPKSPVSGAGVLGVYAVLQRFVYPVIAIAALVLAWRNERLVQAGLLASIPTILGALMVVAFGIGVMIYGF